MNVTRQSFTSDSLYGQKKRLPSEGYVPFDFQACDIQVADPWCNDSKFATLTREITWFHAILLLVAAVAEYFPILLCVSKC